MKLIPKRQNPGEYAWTEKTPVSTPREFVVKVAAELLPEFLNKWSQPLHVRVELWGDEYVLVFREPGWPA